MIQPATPAPPWEPPRLEDYVYRRLSIRLLCLALFTFFTLPAFAQYTRDNAASKKIDEAINEHYLATDFDKAEAVLTGTITACAEKCSPAVLAKAWMYVGIVRGSGKSDQAGAKDAFQKALSTDPTVKLDTQLATPETQKTFGDLGGAGATPAAESPKPAPAAAAANEDSSGDKGGLKCTPDVRELQTRRPIPLECSSDEEVASMELRYKPFGADAWLSVKMKKVGEAFRGEVPCDATGSAGSLKLYVRAKDAAGESVDSFGSKAKPVEFTTSETSSAEPPTYPGEPAAARCVAKEECPPDFPGCSAKSQRGDKDWGVACDNSMECKEGLLCNDGTCESAPSCESSADCQTGSCVEGKCSLGEGSGPSTSTFKKNWLGLHFAQDIAIIGGTNVCGADARQNQGYACYQTGTTDQPYNGDPYPGAGIATGTALATRRLLLSYDRALNSSITIGGRLGLAIGGGPPAGKGPDDQLRGETSKGTKFLPFHAELRLAYWFGKNAMGKKGFRPYVHVGGGIAQVDAKVKVTVADCPNALFSKPAGNTTQGDECANGNPTYINQTRRYTLDAWRKMGQGFITAGGGVMYAFKGNLGAVLNVNIMYMLPTSGPVIQPSLGLEYGF